MISTKTLWSAVTGLVLGLGSVACDDGEVLTGSTEDAVTATSVEAISSTSLARICHQENLALSSCRTISSRGLAVLSPAQTKKLEERIRESTDSWGDSIYEGDVDGNEDGLRYVANKLVKKSDGTLLGYKVRFSFVGWETSCASTNPDYDRTKPETLHGCEMGRIYQTLLVPTDLGDYEILADAELILDSKP